MTDQDKSALDAAFESYFDQKHPSHAATKVMYEAGSPAVSVLDMLIPRKIHSAAKSAFQAGADYQRQQSARQIIWFETELNRLQADCSAKSSRARKLGEERDRLQAELAALKNEPAAPEGWKLVPSEATPTMMNQARGPLSKRDLYGIWKAMIAAAPLPPEQGEKG